MLNLAPSNLHLIESEFNDIIRSSREIDKEGRVSNGLVQRRSYIMMDDSKLYITEHLSGNKIKMYYYDWYNPDGSIRLKIHSETHNDKKYQTKTEPYHIHPGDKTRRDSRHRYSNVNFHDLFHVLELIRFTLIVEANK